MRPVPASCRKGGVLSIPTCRNGNGGGSSEPSATMAFWFLIPNQIFASNTMFVHCDECVANICAGPDRNCEVAKSTRSRLDLSQAAGATSRNLCDVPNKASKGCPAI
jgi:hypothetical protein